MFTEQVLKCRGENRTPLNNILHRKPNYIGHIARRNFFLHDAIEGQMTELKAIGRRTHLDDLRSRRRYWKPKEEAEDPIKTETTICQSDIWKKYNISS